MPTLTGDETEFSGSSGWAKRITIHPENHNSAVSVASWLLFAPDAHPMWSYHTLDVISLREAPGIPEATHRFEGSTHELLVLALNPEYQPYTLEGINDRLRLNAGLSYLTPPDVCEQFEATDEEMRMLVTYMAWGVAHGILIPDSDYRPQWLVSLVRTLAHIRGEKHVS